MNLSANPRLLDLLAASHALGTLRGGARRRFEALAREQPRVRAAALVWQGRLSGMAELQPAVEPAPAVWVRIENLIEAERQQAAMVGRRTAPPSATRESGWLRNLAVWRSAAAVGALATVIAVAVSLDLDQRLRQAPVVQYVAVLSDEQDAPAVLVTFDAKNRQLVLQRVGGYQEGEDKSLQLWALPPGGAAPRSLGVIDRARALTLPASESQVRAVPALAISLEPRGGVPSERGPTGPVLFKGALIEKTL